MLVLVFIDIFCQQKFYKQGQQYIASQFKGIFSIYRSITKRVGCNL